MATHLALDDALIDEAVAAGQHRSKEEAVVAALQEYVEARRRLGILEWIGRVDYFDDYDHKQTRSSGTRGNGDAVVPAPEAD